MSDIQTRPFSKNYSGLINQSAIGLGITVLAVTVQEVFKRKRRGKYRTEGLGSRESWEFGYLYQGRSWAKHPSPPTPAGWPLSWVKQVVNFPEDELRKLRGIDAALYVRFLRGCFWFCLLQSCTTFLILFPIHVHFSDDSVSPKSMTRASISSLVANQEGTELLWIHICLLFWLTISWVATLIWIARGAFRFRAQQVEAVTHRVGDANRGTQYHPHPHPQYRFLDMLPQEPSHPIDGLRSRTVMVSNVPNQLRSEKELKEYFEYYMSRPLDKPSMGLTSSTQPGFLNKWFAFLFNRAKRIPAHIPTTTQPTTAVGSAPVETNPENIPVIDRVVIARKMTELAALLERREEVLKRLETAHLKLAQKTLLAVARAMSGRKSPRIWHRTSKSTEHSPASEAELGELHQTPTIEEEARMKILIEALAPYVEEFDIATTRSRKVLVSKPRHTFRKRPVLRSDEHNTGTELATTSPQALLGREPSKPQRTTVWEALLRLDRNILDHFQPLVHLSHLFRDQTVPAIDYYTAKLGYLTSMITEKRAQAVTDYPPVSTAFITFADPRDARRACKYLAVHPNNPLTCLVTMAPEYNDIDWIRVMKSNFRVEFLKDWVVQLGVWAFTVFWIFPVSLLVGLVSIQSISNFLPKLKAYLDRHPWEEEVIQSFVPTLLVALLALSIPPVLLLIAKKAHTITTLSALHDLIMTRYYKFLIVNVLVFFCVGTAALQSFLSSFKSKTRVDLLKVVADSFPTAGPFYVGWLIFTVAMHGGFELALFGLPLIMYPSTSRQVTPRKRAVGIRPRTFNFYYWLPAHVLVMHILLLFAVLNPLVLPFGAIYYFIESGIVKNQLLHVYAKNYECNGQIILIRVMRYSLDGLMFAHVVFMVYMVVLKKEVNVGLAAFLVIATVSSKIWMTRIVRAQFEADDILEAKVLCGQEDDIGITVESDATRSNVDETRNVPVTVAAAPSQPSIFTWRLPDWVNFTYSSVHQRIRHPARRPPNPFGPQRSTFSRLGSASVGVFGINSRVGEGVRANRPKIQTPDWQPEPIPETHFEERNDLRDSLSPVIPHPPPVSWDDQSNIDLPYDNPYYTRTINDVLWLPRDPFGVLDLDDTINLRTSLTTDPQAGPLGTWFGFPVSASPELRSIASSHSESLVGRSPPRQYTGAEEIDLPSAIARRVRSIENEADVERVTPRRPSLFSLRKASIGDKSNAGRPEDTPPVSFRPFSAGINSRMRSSSIMSTLETPRIGRSASIDAEASAQPDTPTNFVDPNRAVANASGSRVSFAQPLPRPTISTQEAVVTEVMEEENAALINLRKAEREAEKGTVSRNHWLTSWMFTKAE